MSIDLEQLLTETSVVRGTQPEGDRMGPLLTGRGRQLRVMYGETFDDFGPTLDSLKYYFEVARFGKALQQGSQATATILIADLATCHNAPMEEHGKLMAIGRSRADFVRRLSDRFGLGLSVLLMSEYLHTTEFQARLAAIREHAAKQPEILEWVKKTVSQSKRAVEEEKGFAYAFDEIATIMEYDLKVGPPREEFYDEPARMIAAAIGWDPLCSVYLHPTHPLGLGIDFFFANEEIEEFGVTAYKAGSKGLAEHRVVLGKTSPGDLKRLIDSSLVSKNPRVPNPVLELLVIAEMARQWLEADHQPVTLRQQWRAGELKVEDLKELAPIRVQHYIIGPVSEILTNEGVF